MSFFLHGVGHFHPRNAITNEFIESLDIGCESAWVRERVGIDERRTSLDLDYIRSTKNRDLRAAAEAAEMTGPQMGARAAKVALDRAGLGPEDIGLVLSGGSAVDHESPSDACLVAGEMGIQAPCLGVQSACTSFHAGLYMLSMMEPSRLPPFVLLLSLETMTHVTDYSDRATSVLFGDAATAAVVSRSQIAPVTLVGNSLVTDPAKWATVRIPRTQHFSQAGAQVQKFAIRKTVSGLKALQERVGDSQRSLHFIGHQANLRMLERVVRTCELPPERHHSNVRKFGNTASAGSPSVLSMNWDSFAEHDDVAIVGVGAGLTWGGFVVRFGSRRKVELDRCTLTRAPPVSAMS